MRFEHTQVFNFDNALRGMRNPLDSWDKSDSGFVDVNKGRITTHKFKIGENDLKLAQSLTLGGTNHSKFIAANNGIR